MITIAIANEKGGVGKTTTAVTIATGLARLGYKVVLIDTDAQGHCALYLGLDKAIYSRREAWVRQVLAMIVGRVVYQGSKLALTNLWRDTALWSLCGVDHGRPDVDDCYAALDRLLQRRPKIQKALARKHLKDRCLVVSAHHSHGLTCGLGARAADQRFDLRRVRRRVARRYCLRSARSRRSATRYFLIDSGWAVRQASGRSAA